jgi:hypothetical protein
MQFRRWLENTLPVAYHGSDVAFTKFDPSKMGSRTDPGFFGRGAYFVSDPDNAARWGKHVITARIDLKNPLVVSGITDFVNKAGQRKTNGKAEYAAEINRVTDNLIHQGYDGVIYKRSDGTTQYILFFPDKQAITEAKEEIIPCGECFRFATMHANEIFTDGIIPDKEVTVIHATVHPKWHHRAYEHAWVEVRGRCYDWQMSQTKVGSIPTKDFYKEYRPTNIKRYTRIEAIRNMIRSKHHGPWTEGHWYEFQETVTLFHGTSSAFADKIRIEGIQPPDEKLEDYAARIAKPLFGGNVPPAVWQSLLNTINSIRKDSDINKVSNVIYLSTAYDEAASYAKAYHEVGGEIAHDVYMKAMIYSKEQGKPQPRKPLEGSKPIVVEVEVPYSWMKSYYRDLKHKKDMIDRWYDPADKGFRDYKHYMDTNAFEVRVLQPIPPSMITRIHAG